MQKGTFTYQGVASILSFTGTHFTLSLLKLKLSAKANQNMNKKQSSWFLSITSSDNKLVADYYYFDLTSLPPKTLYGQLLIGICSMV